MYFSMLSFLLPLSGALFSPLIATSIVVTFICFKLFFLNLSLTFGIPTFLATLAWTLHKKKEFSYDIKLYKFLLFVMLPTSCMIIFLIHPIAGNAPYYALYWLIPIVIYMHQKDRPQKHVFLNALQSTFIAHAAGSILWLYTMPTSADQWNRLIGIVAIERGVFAIGSTLYLQSSLWLINNYSGVLKSIKTIKGVTYGILHFQNYKKRSS